MTSITRREELARSVDDAMDEDANYFAIEVKMQGFLDTEVIINSRLNMQDKLHYWTKTYDEELVHVFSRGISIVNWAYGNTWDDIRKKLEPETK